MIKKMGQMTFFIILAVVLVFLVVIFFVLFGNGEGGAQNRTDKNVNMIVEDCLEEVILDGIFFNSLQGGFYEVERPKIDYSYIEIPIYYEEGKNLFPKDSFFREELRKFVREHLRYCVLSSGISFESMREVDVLVDNHLVRSTLKSPITLEYEGKIEQYDDFTAEINYDYYEKLILVKEFLALQEKKGNYFPLGELISMSGAGDFEFDILEIDKKTKIVSMEFDDENYEGDKLMFNFGVRYE